MTSGGSGQANPQPGLRMAGTGGTRVGGIDLTGLSITGGKARDDGGAPGYYHPAVGAVIDAVDFGTWADVRIDSGIATEYTIGSGGWYRPDLHGRAGDTMVSTVPVYDSASLLPGASGRGPAIEGMTGFAAWLTPARPVWYWGGAWRDATGSAV
jgi:hypothetical protein